MNLLDETPTIAVPPTATPGTLTQIFPPTVDATMRREFTSCQRAFYFRYVLGLSRSGGASVHLVAGGAFAAGAEAVRHAFYDASSPTVADPDASIAIGVETLLRTYGDYETSHIKSSARMAEALDFYFRDAFPLTSDPFTPRLTSDGIAQVEYSFTLELPNFASLYTGHFDGFFTDGVGSYILDDKTTTSLGAQWLRQWDMRSQFTGYAFAAREYGIRISGILVRGVSILKTKFGHAQVITQRTDFELDRWWEVISQDYDSAYEQFELATESPDPLNIPHTVFPPNLDEACCAYGGCAFLDLCKNAQNPEPFLSQYSIARWNPATGETEA